MGRNSTEILLVGSDRRVSEPLREKLVSRDYAVSSAYRNEEGLARAMAPSVAVVVGQLGDPHYSGLQLLRELHPAKPALPIILVDRELTNENIVEASRLGAYRYVAPPFSIVDLCEWVIKAASSEPNVLTADAACTPKDVDGLVGSSRAMQELLRRIGARAETSATILIRGATGTGKELIARALHRRSLRAARRFIPINCGAIAASLIETELFGYEEGAFTGARGRRNGFFEEADKGTLFLDEIGDLAVPMQAKLLRVLEDREIYRVGGRKPIQLDVRLIAATHRDLEKMVEAGEFREDLFERLCRYPIVAPQLEERREDIWLLTQHFLIKHKEVHGSGSMSMEREAIGFLEKQAWPRNVRELENTVCHAALLASGRPIRLEHVREAYAGGSQKAAVTVTTPAPRSRFTERSCLIRRSRGR